MRIGDICSGSRSNDPRKNKLGTIISGGKARQKGKKEGDVAFESGRETGCTAGGLVVVVSLPS